jgi:flagellar L-ring protein precursor FlgH
MKKAEDRRQKTEVRQESECCGTLASTRQPSVLFHLTSLFCLVFLLSACATPSLPDPSPRYIQPKAESLPAAPQSSANSLWRDTASLYEDNKARRLNDLVTINVLENMTGSGAANTNAARTSSIGAGVTDLFGMPLSASVNKGRYMLTPSVTAAFADDFKGKGATNRTGNLVGTITAKVVEVMPNGNLLLESRKEITINNEKQILILRGMVRPDDIGTDNTILSSRVADAEVFFVGDGVLQEKQRPGWLGRIVGAVWPF